VGKLTGYNDGTSSATYVYDSLGRKVSEEVNYPLSAIRYTLSYSYYANGLKLHLRFKQQASGNKYSQPGADNVCVIPMEQPDKDNVSGRELARPFL
jgi:YD repeat-containing protein